jgi:hypothetical protein
MHNIKPEDMVFETIASFTVLAAGTAFAVLLYRLITLVVPLLETMVLPQVR